MREARPAIPGGLVDLGGDLALWGRTPEGGPWRVAVADPRVPGSHLATLLLEGGGVATSGRDRRRFGPGRSLHHLIDPATGEPARGGPLTVTVVAPEAGRAEAFATLIAVGGRDTADAAVAAHADISALVVPDTGPPALVGPARVEWTRAMEMAS
jgi:thiamine biosynthesis lipoprotein